MFRVLTYHRVVPANKAASVNPFVLSATAEAFEQQADLLASKYSVISLAELLDALRKRTKLSDRAVLLTFDDAYVDFQDFAWPILKARRLPVTVFVPTAYPDAPDVPFWWDLLWDAIATSPAPAINVQRTRFELRDRSSRMLAFSALKQHIKTLHPDEVSQVVSDTCSVLGYDPSPRRTIMTWDDIRSLSRQGVTFASHTRTHPILTVTPPDRVASEINASMNDLRRELGYAPPAFCYPSGFVNDTVRTLLDQAGILAAFTTGAGHNDLQSLDPLRIRRTNVTPRTSPFVLGARLTRTGAAIERYVQRFRSNGKDHPPAGRANSA